MGVRNRYAFGKNAVRHRYEKPRLLVAMRKCPPAATSEPVYGQNLVAASGQGTSLRSIGRSRLHRRSTRSAIRPGATAISGDTSVDLELTQTRHPLPALISRRWDSYLRALAVTSPTGDEPLLSASVGSGPKATSRRSSPRKMAG